MQALKDAIGRYGKGIGSSIIKVDMFLNHRLDIPLLNLMGKALADHFEHKKPDVILTVEASGIALACFTALHLQEIPVVFAKKGKASNQAQDMLTSSVYSFTHQKENTILVDPRYLVKGQKVLIVDDFLANGQATEGLINICRQAECEVIGIGIGIEKGFQEGGKGLRGRGIDVKSLAIVKTIRDGRIILDD